MTPPNGVERDDSYGSPASEAYNMIDPIYLPINSEQLRYRRRSSGRLRRITIAKDERFWTATTEERLAENPAALELVQQTFGGRAADFVVQEMVRVPGRVGARWF
jgi:hypothetical protein